MKDLRLTCACVLLLPAWAFAREAARPPALTDEHQNLSATLRFRTPPGWTVESRPGVPEVAEARGGEMIVRLVRREGELGLDSLHVDCMLVRLAGEMESEARIKYEYDFVGGTLGSRRLLDSAFVVKYDQAIGGAREWRQRNVSVVGGGESVCLIGYAPLPLWKRSKQARALLDAVLASVEFRPWH
jgi:hypothetical protein